MTRLTELVVWWAVLWAVWLATLSTFPAAELVAGAVGALVVAVAAVAGRHAVEGGWRVRPGWVRWLLPVPTTVVTETARVLALPLRGGRRGPVGRIRAVALRSDPVEPVGRDGTHRALATAVLGATPATVVVDTQPDGHVLLVHAIGDRSSRVERAVRS